MFGERNIMFFYFNWFIKKKNRIVNFKGNFIIFIKKLTPITNLDNNFKIKEDQYYFTNYRWMDVILENLHGISEIYPNYKMGLMRNILGLTRNFFFFFEKNYKNNHKIDLGNKLNSKFLIWTN